MSYEPCMCGASDCRFCGPAQGYNFPYEDVLEDEEEINDTESN